MRSYYKAYDDRYRTIHEKGLQWSSTVCTPIVMEILERYGIRKDQKILEIGCGEGRDAHVVLDEGYDLLATDVSKEAVEFCRKMMSAYQDRFRILDCLTDALEDRFDCIYAVAVIHMLVPDEDRDGFYQFIGAHLQPEGVALISTMGDGTFEMQSDITQAFTPKEREHESGKVMVAGTSCRMVSFPTFEKEIERNGLTILEKGITQALPDFNSLMYAVVKKEPVPALDQ